MEHEAERTEGYDLRGVTALVFDIRSPGANALDVQFGFGGQLTNFLHVPPSDTFSTITIPMQSFTTAPVLTDVHELFTVSTNGSVAPNGGTALIDNVHFLPTPDSRQQALGFPVALETFGIVPVTSTLQGRNPIPLDQAMRNASPIADSALTLMALLDRGTAVDLANARTIADAFHYALHHSSQGTSPTSSGKVAATIRNGFKGGDLSLLNDDPIQTGGRAQEARLAGFSSSPSVCGDSAYCVVLDGATGGNVAFAMLGLMSAHDVLGDDVYLADAELLGTWITNELTDTSSPGFGGYYLGYADRDEPSHLVQAKSTADNAIIFAAMMRLAGNNQGPRLQSAGSVNEWLERANVAGDFVMRLADPVSGRFYAGTVPSGTSSSFGITPNGAHLGGDVINTFDNGEANSLAVLALAQAARYRGQFDWRKPVQWLVNSGVTVSASGSTYSGFGLGAETSNGPAGVSWGLTAQAILAMRLVDCVYGGPFQQALATSLDQLALAQSTAPFGDHKGLVGSTLANGDVLAPAEQCLSTYSRCVGQRVELGTTAWSIFADHARNPLSSAELCVSAHRRAVR